MASTAHSTASTASHDVDSSSIEWQVAYDATTSLYTHPRQLAALALMRGHEPPPVETARILELGCATGGNLTSIALSLPSSECVGIDPFEDQIRLARERADRASAQNVTYLPIGVSDLDQLSGSFDYIIAHGLFSWISDAHREDTLKLCHELLSPQGVVYISYNTYPHWYAEQTTRELLRWRHRLLTRSDAPSYTSEELVGESRQCLELFARYASTGQQDILKTIYESSAKRLKQLPGWYIVHEYLLENNRAFSFEEWIEWAERYELRYLGDASPNTDLSFTLIPKKIRREFAFAQHDSVALDQGLDFFLNRGLRRSVMYRGAPQEQYAQSHEVNPWTRTYVKDRLSMNLFITTPYRMRGMLSGLDEPAEYYNVTSTHSETFRTRAPSQNALLILLGEVWPQQLSLRDTLAQAEELLRSFGLWDRGSESELTSALHQLIGRDVILTPTWGEMSFPAQESASNIPKLASHVRSTLQDWPQSFPNMHHTSSFPSRALHWLITRWEPHLTRDELTTLLASSPHTDKNVDELLREAAQLALLSSTP